MPQRERESIQAHSSLDPSGVITSFDELAKGLATGAVSRGKALRWMGSVLVGAALASVPGVGWAAKGGNSACAHFCNEVFPPGPQRGQCKSQGAKGRGPCYSCTPGVGPGPHFSPQCGPDEEFNPETCACEDQVRFGCCLCTEPTNPEAFPSLCSSPSDPNVITSEQECCALCSATALGAYRQCSFVSGPTPLTCAGIPGPIGIECRPI